MDNEKAAAGMAKAPSPNTSASPDERRATANGGERRSGEELGLQRTEERFEHAGVSYQYIVWAPRETGSSRSDAGHPPLVLVHGFSQSVASWEEVAKQLAVGRTVYAIDLVGHGHSDCPQSAEPYELAFQGKALLAFLEYAASQCVQEEGRCGVGKMPPGASEAEGDKEAEAEVVEGAEVECGCAKVDLLGYSMGGRVALAAAAADEARFTRTVRTLVLESAGLGPASDQEREAAAERDRVQAQRLREEGLAAFMDAWERLPLFATQTELPEPARANLRAARMANHPEALARTFEHAGQHTMPSRAQTLALLTRLAQDGVALVYLAGARDAKYRALAESLTPQPSKVAATRTSSAPASPDAASPDRPATESLAATQPPIRVHLIPNVGHNTHLECPEAFTELLLNELAR